MPRLNHDNITETQIKTLRTESLNARDYLMADWCDLALAAHETADSQGSPLIDPHGMEICRSQAREVCADAINDGNADDCEVQS